MDFDWKALVRTVAPTIASAFGTPLAGMGVTAILNAIIPADQPKPTDPDAYLAQTLATATPELMLKIKEAENKFAVDMKTLGVELEKLTTADRASARDMKVKILQYGKWDYEPLLALLVCCAFGFAEFWVFQYASAEHTMEPNQAILVGRMLGIVDAAFMTLLYFRWGNSRSSEQKNDTISNMAQAANK